MKKHIFLGIVFVLFCLEGKSQYYSTQLDYDGTSEYGSQVVIVDDGFLLLNSSICGADLKECAGLFKTNFGGEILWKKEIDSLDVFSFESILKDGEDFFIINAPPVSEGQLDENIFLQKFNKDGELQGEWTYGGNEIEEYPTAIAKLNNYILIVEKYTEVSTGRRVGCLLFIDDETFTVERKIPFNDDFSDFVTKHLLVDSEGNILLPFLGLYNTFLTGQLIKYDSTGMKLWETTLNVNDDIWGVSIDAVELQNGNYAVGWYYPGGLNEPSPPIVYGLNSSGDILWQRPFPDTIGRKNIDELSSTQNGDIIGVGMDLYIGGDYDDFSGSGGWIFRLSQEGNVLWERTIVDLTLRDYVPLGQFLLDGAEMDNGDLVFTGLTHDTFPNGEPFFLNPDTWLLRLDSEGCLVPDCGNLQVIIGDSVYTDIKEIPIFENDLRVSLFPNPAVNNLIIDVQGDFNFDKNEGAGIAIYDIQGRLVLFKKTTFFPKEIEVSNLADGLYFVSIDGHFVERFIKQ